MHRELWGGDGDYRFIFMKFGCEAREGQRPVVAMRNMVK